MSAVARPAEGLTGGHIETLKWLAVVCMVVDHVNAVFFGREWGEWATIIGRVSFPLFAIVLGVNLARPGVDHSRVLMRLVAFGSLALPAHGMLFGMVGLWPLNVMFTFAVAVAVVWAMDRGDARLSAVLFFGASLLVEYWLAGVALVVASVAAARWSNHRWPWVPFAIAMALLCLVNGNVWALLALPVVAFVQGCKLDAVPRLRWAFYVFYPSHLVVLAVLSRV